MRLSPLLATSWTTSVGKSVGLMSTTLRYRSVAVFHKDTLVRTAAITNTNGELELGKECHKTNYEVVGILLS